MRSSHPSASRAPYHDAHVHLRDVTALEDLARAGVGAVRDAGSREGFGLSLCSRRGGEGPVIRTAGRALVKKGGYGALLGVPLSSRDEIEAEIAHLADAGAGIIKVVASGVVSLKRPGSLTPGGFDRHELRCIVQAAAGRGLAVMAHANGAEAIQAAVEAGVRSIEHGFFMTSEMLAAMRSGNVLWVPTVGALQRAATASGAGVEARRAVEELIERHLAMIGEAFARGVPLAIGTDCVLPDRRYGGHYRDELIYFRKAGIPDEAVERIASDGGREPLGM